MRRAALALGLLMAAAQPSLAQRAASAGDTTTGRPCKIVVDYIARYNQAGAAYYGGGGVRVHCDNQPTTMNSDSMAWYSQISELHLLGNVHVRDSISALDADQATYWVKQEHIFALGHVFTRNTHTGSSLRGPNLDYYRAAPRIRDTVEIRATGRPTINFYRSHDSTASDTVKPFVIVADRVHMKGNDRMWGGGHVTVDRGTLTSVSDSANLDLTAEHGELLGHPSVADTSKNSYRLIGRNIAFDLDSNNDVRQVIAKDSADATGPDWFMSGDTLVIAIDSSKVQRAQAWGRNRRAKAVSDRNVITADSLDINMPRGVVSLVWGYGRGKAVSPPDSTAPDSEPDWMTGDTLRARFAQRRVFPVDSLHPDTMSAEADSARYLHARMTGADTGQMKSELQHVTAYGKARAYYHSDNDQEHGGPRGISYARGRRIDIALNRSKVHTVDVVGLVDGIFLEPFTRAERDSAHADSLRADSLRRAGALVPGDSARDTTRDTTRVRPGTPPAQPPGSQPAPRPAPADTTTRERPLPGRRP